MHELSIVMGIIELAEKEAKKANAEHIESIELEIGSLSGIENAAFDFAWESAIKNTILENAKREINHITAISRCVSCDHEFESKTVFDKCPKCGEIFTTLIKGKELKVKAITVQ